MGINCGLNLAMTSQKGVSSAWFTQGIYTGSTMVLDFVNDRYMLAGAEVAASALITGHTGLIDANGIHIDTEDVHFTDQTWHNSAAGTILMSANHTHATNIVLLGMDNVEGIETHPDPDRVEHWEGTTLLTAITAGVDSPPTPNWSTGAKMALSWQAVGSPAVYSRRLCMGGGTVASDANDSGNISTIYLGSRNGSQKWWNGYIEYMIYFPDFKSESALQTLTT